MALPKRLFYSLDEAVHELSNNRKIPCTIGDLLHFATIGNIDLLIFIDGLWLVKPQSGNKESLPYIGEPTNNSYESNNINILSNFDFSGSYRNELINISIIKPSNLNYIISITGLMSFRAYGNKRSFFHHLSRNHSIDLSSVLLYSSTRHEEQEDKTNITNFSEWINSKFTISFDSKLITLKDIYITNSELEYLTNENIKKKRVTPDLISTDTERYIKTEIEKGISPKSNNHMTLLIGALIEAIAPKAIEKPYSNELSQVLSRKGIEMPIKPDALAKYINQYKTLINK